MPSVYLIRHGDLVKIGWSRNVQSRLASLDAERPGCELLHTIPCPFSRLLENALHQRFLSRRAKGEWFALTEADLSALLAVGPLDGPQDLPAELQPEADAPGRLPPDGGSGSRLDLSSDSTWLARVRRQAARFGLPIAGYVRRATTLALEADEKTDADLREALRAVDTPPPPR